MTELTAWLLSIGSFAAVVILTAVAAKSLAGDAPRGRRRCPRCWHELGPTGLLCSECGHTAAREIDTQRNRRSIVRGALAVIGILAIAVTARTRFLDRGPWSGAPTSLLIFATPYFAEGGFHSCPWELTQRIQLGRLDDERLLDALRLFITGDSDAMPSTPAWEAKYGPIGRAVIQKLSRDNPALLELLRIPPTIQVRVLFGDGSEPLLSLDAQAWWPPFIEGRAEIRFADGTMQLAGFDPSGRYPALLVPVPPGLLGSRCGVVLSQRIRGLEKEWTPFPEVTIAITDPNSKERDSQRASEDRGLEAVDSPALREGVAAVFSDRMLLWKSGSPHAGLRFDALATSGEEFDGVAVGLFVELLEAGVVRRTSRIWWKGGTGSGAAGEPRWLPSLEDEAALGRLFTQDTALDAQWTLRVRGDRGLACYATQATESRGAESVTPSKWFSGMIEIPAGIERVNRPSPTRRWRLLEP